MTNDHDGDHRPFEAEWDEEDRVLSGEAPHTAHATAKRERDEARAELNKLRAEMSELRAELASTREKAIKECEALAHDLSKSYEDRAKLPHAKRTALWSQRMTQACVASEVADGIHALLACDSSPQEPSKVCSNCDGDGLDPVTTSGDNVNDLDDDELCCSACGGTGVCGGWPVKDEKGQG